MAEAGAAFGYFLAAGIALVAGLWAADVPHGLWHRQLDMRCDECARRLLRK